MRRGPRQLQDGSRPFYVLRAGFRWPLRVSVLLLAALTLLGCQRGAAPELLEVSQVGPSLLEAGEQLLVRGDGFPERRTGTLTLDGVTFVPGRSPETLRFQLPILAASSSRLEARLTPQQIEELTDGAPHLTFRGTARVRFQPQRPGGATLTGSRDAVVLDVFQRDAGSTTRSELASDFASHVGLSIDSRLHVNAVELESEAQAAGLKQGDQLLELDGVRLLSLGDFIPRAHGLVSGISYRRPGYAGTAQADVARAGYQTTDPVLTFRALSIAAGLLVALLIAARPPRLLIWLFSRSRRRPVPAHESTGLQVVTHLSFALAVAGLWTLLRQPPEDLLDLPVLLCLGIVPLVLAAFVAGGHRTHPGRFSFGIVGAFAGAISTAFGLLPMLLAVLFWAAESGTLRFADFARAQTQNPATWGFVDSPWAFLLGLFAFLSLVPGVGRRPPLEGHGGSELGLVPRVLESVGQLALVGVWLVLFAGGIAGLAPASWQAGGILAAKFLLAVTALRMLRLRTGNLRWSESWSLWGRLGLLFSVVVTGGGLLLSVHPLLEAQADLLGAFSLSVAVALAVLLAISGLRSFSHHGRQTDPWI